MSSGLAVVDNIGQLVTCAGRGDARAMLGVHDDAAVVIEGGRVVAAGRRQDIRQDIESAVRRGAEVCDARGGVVVPGLVDCHTHVVFGGDRLDEFCVRCRGATYEEIARRGGGIVRTVEATRRASPEELEEAACRRLDAMLLRGVTTVEVKSGYGLDLDTEVKMLEVVARLDAEGPQRLVPTFLGAHVVPREFSDRPEAYVAWLCDEALPLVAHRKLARYCDVFCDEGAFGLDATRRIFERARELGLGLRVHAEQLRPTGAARLAAELGAASADHLEHIDDDGIDALRRSGTVAVLLPAATLFLGQSRWAPARRLLDAGVRVALATDCNPGSAMTTHLPLVGTLGCVRLHMEPAEVLLALTRWPAVSLGLDDAGVIRPGARADLAWFDVARFEELFYEFPSEDAAGVISQGQVLWWGWPAFEEES